METLIKDPMNREMRLKKSRLKNSSNEKPTPVFLPIRFFQGLNSVVIRAGTEKKYGKNKKILKTPSVKFPINFCVLSLCVMQFHYT